MKQSMFITLAGIVLLSGCYCKKFVRGYSSPRDLKVVRSYTLRYEPQGMRGGKSFLVTAYTGDPYFQRMNFTRNNSLEIISGIEFTSGSLWGLRMERFLKLGAYPGPLLGMGLDYSRNQFTAQYTTAIHKLYETQVQEVKQHRALLSLNYVTWIRDKMMGYISVQPGTMWEVRKIESSVPKYSFNSAVTGILSLRLAYGFHFYFRQKMIIILEAGYGGGCFLRGGLCAWGR